MYYSCVYAPSASLASSVEGIGNTSGYLVRTMTDEQFRADRLEISAIRDHKRYPGLDKAGRHTQLSCPPNDNLL